MLIVCGTVSVEQGRREAYLEEYLPRVESVRQEPGCVEYGMSPDPLDANRLRVFEQWASAEDLDRHLGSPRAHPAVPVVGADIVVYEATETRRLAG